MGSAESSLNNNKDKTGGNLDPEHNWNHFVKFMSGFISIWFLFYILAIVAAAVWIDTGSGSIVNAIYRFVGLGRNFPLVAGYKKMKSMEDEMNTMSNKIDELEKKINKPQQGGGRKSSSFTKILLYLNLCFILACSIVFLIYPSLLKKIIGNLYESTPNNRTPAFSIN